jgi:tetratricopeptide (TPR) repeat protein
VGFHGRSSATSSVSAIGLLVAIALLASTARTPARFSPSREGTAPRRVVLVGLDAADWSAIDPLVRAGKLPTFARLEASGRTGVMRPTPPLISPIIWTTIATGMPPEEHGVLDFLMALPDGSLAPVGSSHRRVPAIWNLFSDAGRTVAIVGWWATWPAEDVRGTIVSDALAPQLIRPAIAGDAGLVNPPARLATLRGRIVTRDQMRFEDLAAYVPLTRREFEAARGATGLDATRLYQNRIAHLAAAVASSRTYAGMAIELARSDRPDLLAVYIEDIDTVSHLFVTDPGRGPQAIERVYRDADELILALASASDPSTLVVVCSDHGFYPASAGVTEDPSNLAGPATAWHRPYGIVAIAEARDLAAAESASGPPSRPGGLGSVTPEDLAPTLLHLAGLPVIDEMPGRVVSAMLPADIAAAPVERRPPPEFTPPPLPQTTRRDRDEALARLRALGYVGASGASLARQNLGEILFREGKYAAAERELRAVVASQPQNLNAHLWLAKCLGVQGRTTEAIRIYGLALALPDGAESALVEAVDLALASHQPDAAADLVARAGNAPGAESALAVARGTLAEARGQLRAAEREFRAALKVDPLSFEAADRLLSLVIAAGRAESALPPLRHAVDVAPESPRHLALLGTALLATHDSAGAERAFDRALALSPESDAVRLSLGRALLTQQKTDRAIDVLRPAASSAERSTLLGAAYSSKGQWAEASRELRAALDLGGESVDVLNGLGWAALKLGERQDAARLFSRSLEMNPQQPEIRRLLDDLKTPGPGTLR